MLFGQEHIERYEATNGEEGHDWRGAPTLILTTKGRKSGKERKAPLIYGRRGDAFLVVASKGGSPEPPAWYRNLQADPSVEVQVRGEKFPARARDATPEEQAELWKVMTAQWPDYDTYQTRTERRIPIVVLERA